VAGDSATDPIPSWRSHVEAIMGARPFLALELEEHGGDAGDITRAESGFRRLS